MNRNVVCTIALGCALWMVRPAAAQTSGTIVIKSFQPGSSRLDDPTIDRSALARLDSLMQFEDVEALFLGAADSLRWKVLDRPVHPHVSDALDNAKRLGRARTLRARYNRGNVGVTDENLAGVKVVWTRGSAPMSERLEFDRLVEQNRELTAALDDLRREVDALQRNQGDMPIHEVVYQREPGFNWRLQTGFWSIRGGDAGALLTPSLALSIIHDKTTMVVRAGVTPWHYNTANGDEAESFLYLGVKYQRSRNLGVSLGAFRGWRFFTDSDNWSMKTTGAAFGLVLQYAMFEFSPMLTYGEVASLTNETRFHLGSLLGLSLRLN